jgi:RHS repeat-associated protein
MAAPILCALLAAFQVVGGTVSERPDAETRVRGINLPLEAASGLEGEASAGRHRGIGYTYGETVVDRADQYNGRVFDQGTGFHDYGARMYWPQIGRFISPDTAAPDLANPASFNRYGYVLNNPYKYVDPTGLTPEGAFKGAMIGGSVGGAVGFLLGGGGGAVVAAVTGGGGVVAVPVGAVEGGALGSGIGIAIGHWVGDLVSGPDVMQANATTATGKPSSAGKMQKEVERDQAPGEVKRVDRAHTPQGEPHVHYKDGTSSSQSGSVHDAHKGTPSPSKETQEWIQDHGWTPLGQR